MCLCSQGDSKLPSREAMWQEVRQKQQDMAARYTATQRHTIQVDFIPFLDELAVLLGCKPNISESQVSTVNNVQLIKSRHASVIALRYGWRYTP